MSNEHPDEINNIEGTVEQNENQDCQFTESYKNLYEPLDESKGEESDESKRKSMKKDVGGKLYSCDECERTFNHPSSLMYHKESVHNDGRRFVCSKCGKSFTHKQLLQRHQMVHSDTRFAFKFWEEKSLVVIFFCFAGRSLVLTAGFVSRQNQIYLIIESFIQGRRNLVAIFAITNLRTKLVLLYIFDGIKVNIC